MIRQGNAHRLAAAVGSDGAGIPGAVRTQVTEADEALDALTRAYIDARYSGRDIGVERGTAAQRQFQQVRQAMIGWLRRLRRGERTTGPRRREPTRESGTTVAERLLTVPKLGEPERRDAARGGGRNHRDGRRSARPSRRSASPSSSAPPPTPTWRAGKRSRRAWKPRWAALPAASSPAPARPSPASPAIPQWRKARASLGRRLGRALAVGIDALDEPKKPKQG